MSSVKRLRSSSTDRVLLENSSSSTQTTGKSQNVLIHLPSHLSKMAENSSDDENESSYHPDDDNDEQVSEEDLIADDSDDGQKSKMSSLKSVTCCEK